MLITFCSFDVVYRDESKAATPISKDSMHLSSLSNFHVDELVHKLRGKSALERLLQPENLRRI